MSDKVSWDSTGFCWAVAQRLWPAVPVFHRFKGSEYHPEVSKFTETALCGLRSRSFTWLPKHHAAKFGRPCKKCWEVSP